ncbi:MAG: tetratricopeptide repeat protein [Planctomycetes bacterium]|nr:tetratricopeptide repeat protein [Planctomycetota bacterium]
MSEPSPPTPTPPATPRAPAALRAALEELQVRCAQAPRQGLEELAALQPELAALPQDVRAPLLAARDAIGAGFQLHAGDLQGGVELARNALRFAELDDDPRTLLRATNALAEGLMQLGHLAEARGYLQEGLAHGRARGVRDVEIVRLYGNLAALGFYSGHPARALEPLSRALELATELGDDRRRALMLGNFGNLYGQLGEHERALDSHRRCAELLRAQGARGQLANSLHNVGVELDRLGRSEEALEVYAESLALRGGEGDAAAMAKTELDRAFALVHLERLDEAETAIERALAINRETGCRVQEARALTSLGNLEYERKRYREAIARFEESRALVRAAGERGPFTGNELGLLEAHLALGDTARVLELLVECEPLLAGGLPPARAAELCDLGVRASEAAGLPERALGYAKRRIELMLELHASDARRTTENLQGMHQIELLRQRERDQARVRADLEALVAERTRQLVEANDQLEARVDELVRAELARSRLEEELRQAQKMDAIGRLAGGVAHDFNNLLTVILGRGELLLEELPEGHPGHDSLREILEAASRAARLTVQLLAFGRKQALRPTRLDVGRVLTELERLLDRLLGERIFVDVVEERAGGGPLVVQADRGQLDQVLINLAINARDAMPEGGRLEFRATRIRLPDPRVTTPVPLPPGDYVRLRVSDTGTGMDDRVRERAFEPFFTTKEPGKGTGLGLSTVHGIVHQSGGTVRVESAPGRGTTVEVLLPCAAGVVEAKAPEARVRPVQRAACVLIVEDDEGLRRMMREGLSRRGYQVREAPDGLAALGLVEGADAVICDRVLPKLGGLEVLAQVRTTHPDLPFLLISGHPSEDDSEAALGVRFLAKPFKLEALARVLQELLA